MEAKYKRRNRVPSSCSVCRKRKSKCDRIRPVCGSCKKKSIAHLCFYEGEGLTGHDSHDASLKDQLLTGDKSLDPQLPNHHISPLHGSHNLGSFSHHQSPPIRSGSSPTNGLQSHMSAVPPHPASSIGHPSPGNMSAAAAAATGAPQPPPPPGNASTSPYNYYPSNIPSTEMFTRNSNGMPLNHGIAPPPPPPMPGSIPMPHQIPPVNYYEENGEYYRSGLTPSSVQLPPIKGPNDNTVIVSIGPNSSLAINPEDQIEEFFSNASFPLLLEGPYLQNHGFLTYVGLTKSDRFVKFFRKFAVELLRKGEISEFIPRKKRRKTSTASSPANQRHKSSQSSPNSGVPSVRNDASPTGLNKLGSTETFNDRNENDDHEKTDKPNNGTGDPDSKEKRSSENSNYSSPAYSSNGGVNGNGIKTEPATKENQEQQEIRREAEEQGKKEEENIDEEEEEEEDVYEYDEEETGVDNKEVDDEEDILVITKINVAKEQKENDKKNDKEKSLSIMPGLKAIYLGQNSRKEYFKIVEEAVLKILPSKINLLTLMSRYFKWVHPFVPIINEEALILDFNQIVDEFPDFSQGSYTSLTIKSDKHLTIIGIMLLIARLGYLSLIHNHSINNQYGEKETNVLNECKAVPFKTFADVVNLCTPDEHTSLRSTFRMVQLLSLTYFYRQVAPNDCHGVGAADSQILFGNIVRHALSIGLNRDPMKYIEHETINKNKYLVETWRNLWHFLVVTDASTAMYRSSVLNIYSSDIGDVETVEYAKENKELKDTLLTVYEISKSYRKLVMLFSNFKRKPRVIDMLAETNRLEHIFLNFFGRDFFKDFICKPASSSDSIVNSKEHIKSYVKVIKYLTFILLRANLSSIYYVIAMNYERKYNEDKTTSISSGVELFKIHFKSVVQLVYIMSYVFDNSVELFGKNYDYILTAANERYMIKTHSFLTSFFIRLIHQKQLLSLSFASESADRLEAINKLFNMILVEAELFVGNFRMLSLRYVNSYKIYVLSYYVLKQCMENAEVFFKYALSDPSMILDTTNMLQYFTASEINYLCKLCEEFRFAKDSQERQRRANALFNLNLPTNSATSPQDSLNTGEFGTQTSMNNSMGASDIGANGIKSSSKTTPASEYRKGSDVDKGMKSNDNINLGSNANTNTSTDNAANNFGAGNNMGFTDPISINQLNPMKDFENIFKMPKPSSSASNAQNSMDSNNMLNDLSDLHDGNFKSDDFIKLFELYGDTGNPHLE